MDGERKTDRTPAGNSKIDMASKGPKPAPPAPGNITPVYPGADTMHMAQSMAIAPAMMPYYGQYGPMYAMPPGAAPMGYPMQQAPMPGGATMWMPGMMPAPPPGAAAPSMPAQPYGAPYHPGPQPMMYMPVPYGYSPYMPAPAAAPAPATASASYPVPPAKAPAQGAAPAYNASASASTTTPHPHLHPHSHAVPSTVEPVMLSPMSVMTPANPGTTVGVPPAAAASTNGVPTVTPIALSMMPLMPHTWLPPGDPFCPAGVPVPSQYTTTTSAPHRFTPMEHTSPAKPQAAVKVQTSSPVYAGATDAAAAV